MVVDPIDHILYNGFGTVESSQDGNLVLLVLNVAPRFGFVKPQIHAYGENFRRASEELVRQIQAELVKDPPDLHVQNTH